MSLLSNLINVLQSQGIFEYYLPFLLTFSIFYALLIKSKIFGDNKPGPAVSLVVALIAGIYVTIFTPVGVTLSGFFVSFFAQASVFLILIVVIGITMAAMASPMLLKENFSIDGLFTKGKWIIPLVVTLVCLAMFSSSLKKIPGFPSLSLPSLGISGDDIALIFLLLATGLLIFWVQKGTGNVSSSSGSQSNAEPKKKDG